MVHVPPAHARTFCGASEFSTCLDSAVSLHTLLHTHDRLSSVPLISASRSVAGPCFPSAAGHLCRLCLVANQGTSRPACCTSRRAPRQRWQQVEVARECMRVSGADLSAQARGGTAPAAVAGRQQWLQAAMVAGRQQWLVKGGACRSRQLECTCKLNVPRLRRSNACSTGRQRRRKLTCITLPCFCMRPQVGHKAAAPFGGPGHRAQP